MIGAPFDPDNNYPPGFREEDHYPQLRTRRSKPKPPPPPPLTDEEREERAKQFARVDEWDLK